MAEFQAKNFSQWLKSYFKYAFTPRYKFQTYEKSNQTGVYDLTHLSPLQIAIAGDWGTGTQEADDIAALMSATKPHLTIHLGDVYFVGDVDEIEENCLGKKTGPFDGVQWPPGSHGSFALNGNHEMYANGTPYFTTFLPTLGMPAGAGQHASYFCLETAGWRIIALDTGYNSAGLPILNMIPVIKNLSVVDDDCHLEPALLDWLRQVVRPRENPKPTLLLSHHQYFTAFNDQAYTKPATQLMEFFADQQVAWLWGHEHRLGIYDIYSKSNGPVCYGRCIGHGGMPVELSEPDLSKAPLRYFDQRSHKLDDGTAVGENGFARITIEQNVLKIEYVDIHNQLLLAEQFTPAADPNKLDYRLLYDAKILKAIEPAEAARVPTAAEAT